MPAQKVERFLTTVLFTDIVGSTEHAAELGDRAWRDLVQSHHALVRAALKRHGGREVDTAGDSFFAVFDAPAAAIACAVEIRRGVPSLGLQVRAGLHVGEVEQIAGKVGGITVPIASRIMSAAGPGEVLVSSTVRDLAAGANVHFEDRGTRELKGVPGEWRLFAIAEDTELEGAGATETESVARRAAAARRQAARPIWQRHPRAVAFGAVGLAILLVAGGLLVWQPWLPPPLASVGEDSIALIDPGRNVVVAATSVGHQPTSIAAGEGSLWVANEGDDSVSDIDPSTHAVVDTVDVGRAPSALVVGAGSVWVTNGDERTVTRINLATRRVVDTITVGNGPSAIAFGANAVWVANARDGTVSRIDAATGVAGPSQGVGVLPTAIAADDSGVWVASADAGTVIYLDPATGQPVAAAVAVGTRPSAIALGDGAVWVANEADGSISKIDAATRRVIGVLQVGGAPVGLALDGTRLWIADQSGGVESLDVDRSDSHALRINVGAAPSAIVVVDHSPWFVTRAAAASHRGGTMRIVSSFGITVDPGNYTPAELTALVGDGLVGYRRVGGVAGAQLVPDLAESIPQPTDGGLTYTFKLRSGLVYDDGSPVRPSDFKFALERAFQIDDPDFSNAAAQYFPSLVGLDACAHAPVARCDLSQAIVPDDSHGIIVFHLARADPDFLYELALPLAEPLPEGSVPANALIVGPHPVTGPYRITSVTDSEVHLARNPNFHSWDADARPDGYVDEIVWSMNVDPADGIAQIESGDADYIVDQIPADSFPDLRTRYTPQLHFSSASTTYLFMNVTLPPFDNPNVRRAVALAVDRGTVVELRGGEFAAQPTCQVLPPNFPGYEPYCPSTIDPGPAGTWTAPDLVQARQLVAASGTGGMKVVVGPMPPRLTPLAEYVATVLDDLGYDASSEAATDGSQVFQAIFIDKRVQIGGFEFGADFPAPDTFFGQFACGGDDDPSFYCDAAFDAALDAARDLQSRDPAAANRKWAEIDRMVTDLGLWAPLINEGSDFVSARIGGYQFNVGTGFLIDQAWVQ